ERPAPARGRRPGTPRGQARGAAGDASGARPPHDEAPGEGRAHLGGGAGALQCCARRLVHHVQRERGADEPDARGLPERDARGVRDHGPRRRRELHELPGLPAGPAGARLLPDPGGGRDHSGRRRARHHRRPAREPHPPLAARGRQLRLHRPLAAGDTRHHGRPDRDHGRPHGRGPRREEHGRRGPQHVAPVPPLRRGGDALLGRLPPPRARDRHPGRRALRDVPPQHPGPRLRGPRRPPAPLRLLLPRLRHRRRHRLDELRGPHARRPGPRHPRGPRLPPQGHIHV
ncbi:MAG: hypothetical protein AVDCRST_MAG05-3884, partial [uncultured Rubrobacteraceae bacterium]